MTDTFFYILIISSTIIIFLLLLYLIYTYTGWNSFTMTNGQNFKINGNSVDVSNITFKNCIYTITNPANNPSTYSRDVTSQLNYMVRMYKGNTNSNFIFKLDGGLSQYSFVIQGFSDYNTLKSYNIAIGSVDPLTGLQSYALPPEWTNSSVIVTLTGSYK
jgi:phage-related tail fiber protein